MRTVLRTLLILYAITFIPQLSFSAPLEFVPQTLIQPNGDTLQCYASGDEFYSWLHDEKGYIIVQNQSTGYYVYAINLGEDLIPTAFIVGRSDPSIHGITKNLNSSSTRIQEIYLRRNEAKDKIIGDAPTIGSINNLVVFIRFSDESEFNQNISYYDDKFNNGSAGANSLYNYYLEASYNQLAITTTFYPNPSNSMVVSFQGNQPRNYYRPYSETNPIGFSTNQEGELRMHALMVDAVNYIGNQVPIGLNIDQDNDEEVDDVCFLLYGSPDGWNAFLWPHKSVLWTQTVNINGKRVYDYNVQFQNYSYNGVFAHEMFHVLGAPDLYHYSQDGLHPAAYWDIMDMTHDPPQHMSAYMKYKYGRWINWIPEIVTSGVKTLDPLTSSSNNCFKIESPYSTSEFFVIEYRKREGTFEGVLPGDGLIIYRINSEERGNALGPPDEVYVYRPDGTINNNGNPLIANFSSNVGRTTFNDISTNPLCFLTDGSPGGLSIQNIGAANATINFTVNASTFPPQFTQQTGIDLPDVQSGSVSWGDYNNDNYLDLIITGNTVLSGPAAPIAQLYVNDQNGNFYNSNIVFDAVYNSSAKWGDYNNDGYLDVVICGYTGSTSITRLYKNENGNTFVPVTTANIIGVQGSLDWGDYNNDGYLDLVLAGLGMTRVYKNNKNDTFTFQSSFNLRGVSFGEVKWADFNNDGRLDIFLTGQQNASTYISTIYYNNGDNSFTEQQPANIPGVSSSCFAIGDYDSDGDLDIFLTGQAISSYVAKLFRNDGNNFFTEIQTAFTMLLDGETKWGDIDNDGDLDLIETGMAQTRVYKNQGNDNFTRISLPNSFGTYPYEGSVAFGDYDNDGDLDYAVLGRDINNVIETRVYKNEEFNPNTAPTAPVNLSSNYDATGITFSWNKSYYDGSGTPRDGLTYNLVVSTTSGGFDILSPMSVRGGINDGDRKVIGIGNTSHNNTWKITGLGPGIYYWSVQTIDNSFAGSPFATQRFVNYPFPVELTSFKANLIDGNVKLSWMTATEVNNYGFEIERSLLENGWNNIGFVQGHGNSNSPKSYSFIDDKPLGGSKFKYRLKQIDTDGQFEYSNEVEIEIVPKTFALFQNYPNPFNPNTTIKFSIAKEANVNLGVYSMSGERVKELKNEMMKPGYYDIEFNATDLASGVYMYRIKAGDFVETKKMILMK